MHVMPAVISWISETPVVHAVVQLAAMVTDASVAVLDTFSATNPYGADCVGRYAIDPLPTEPL